MGPRKVLRRSRGDTLVDNLNIPLITKMGMRGVIVDVTAVKFDEHAGPCLVLTNGKEYRLPAELFMWAVLAQAADSDGRAEFGYRKGIVDAPDGFYAEWLHDDGAYFDSTIKGFEERGELERDAEGSIMFPTAPSVKEPESSFHNKYDKLVYDYRRAHNAALAISPDHVSFMPTAAAVRDLRYAVDDLAADIIAAWDELVKAVLQERGLAGLGLKKALEKLRKDDPAGAKLLDQAWGGLFIRINEIRNEFQHEKFWEHAFMTTHPSKSPVLADPHAKSDKGDVWVLRDARRAGRTIKRLADAFKLCPPIARFPDACGHCVADDSPWAA